MKHLLSILSVLIMAYLNTACALGNNKQNVKLDESLLRQATSIIYSLDNRSVAPEYYYNYICEATVYKESVRLSVTDGEGLKIYNRIVRLKDGQYEQFISTLVKQSIKKIPPRGPMPPGVPTILFRVLRGNSTLFEGKEGFNIEVEDGSLFDTFIMIFPPELQDIMKNPECLLYPI